MSRRRDRRRKNKARSFGFPGTLLSRRDWVYLLSLLVPFIVYNLTLKANSVLSQPDEAPGFIRTLDLMRSDIFFSLGYALLWIGLFAVARREPLRWVVVALFHAVTVFVLLVTTCAHQYLQENGTALDYGTIAEWIPKFEEIVPILTRDISPSAFVVLGAALLYALLGPLVVTLAVGWWRGWAGGRSPAATAATPSFFFVLSSVGIWLLAFGFGALSLLIGSGPADASKSFARDRFVNVVVTGVEQAAIEKEASDAVESGNSSAGNPAVGHPAINATLAETLLTEKRNVVLIHLESTRAQSVTPYNEDLRTMPFLDELADSSLLAEQSYTVVPRSSKASVTVNCGIEPPLYPGPEFEPNGIPAQCLPELLKEQGYRTVFFASTSNTMDNFGDVAEGFGYEEIYPSETMNTEGFQVTNTFGYEEEVMLEPSAEWLRENGDEPFMAEYFTGTGHYAYECVPNRYGYQNFSEDEELDRYHNCMRMLDFFLQDLFEQYKELGLYEDTIFVVFGDHGEGFGEHDRFLHGDTIYEEGLKVPLIIHDPQRFESGERVEGLSSQLDILPTVLEMLGYKVENGEYPGYSLLREPPANRTLMFSCISNRKCLASIQGNEKYIYHYDDLPDELFDVSSDPLEERNLAGELSEEEKERRRKELLTWRSQVNAEYGAVNPR